MLELAAGDDKVLAQLADDPVQVLGKFNLTYEEHAVLASGDAKVVIHIDSANSL